MVSYVRFKYIEEIIKMVRSLYNKDLIENVRQWKKDEEIYSKELGKTVEKAESPMLKLILTIASLDSYKHSIVYGFIEEMLNKGNEVPMLQESKEVLKSLENHILEESKAMEFLIRVLEDNNIKNDKFLEFAFKLIYKDEVLHHILLHDAFNALINLNDNTMKELYEAIDNWIKPN